MGTVLGPMEVLKKNMEHVVGEHLQSHPGNLRVVINNTPSVRRWRYEAKRREIAVQEEKSFLGLKRYKTVVALEYPYNSRCVEIVDERYSELGKEVKDVIWELERRAVPNPFW